MATAQMYWHLAPKTEVQEAENKDNHIQMALKCLDEDGQDIL